LHEDTDPALRVKKRSAAIDDRQYPKEAMKDCSWPLWAAVNYNLYIGMIYGNKKMIAKYRSRGLYVF
jgi:hypothetical protein